MDECPAELAGSSGAMQCVWHLIDRAAASSESVLIEGECFTGQEIVARALHARSARRDAPFVALNCAALAPTLLMSELFGHRRGCFCRGASHRPLLELADGG